METNRNQKIKEFVMFASIKVRNLFIKEKGKQRQREERQTNRQSMIERERERERETDRM